MRSLIRPALFTFVRLGVFLAVVAWVVAQWYQVEFRNTRVFFAVQLNSAGWLVSELPLFIGGPPTSTLDTDPDSFQAVALKPSQIDAFGISAEFRSLTRYLLVRHWLIVTVFALFYAVLKWVYRERPGNCGQRLRR